MKRYILAGLVCSVTFLGASANADVIYPIDLTITGSYPSGNPLQSDTVIGSITTDGTIGALAPSDILSWNLDLIDNLNSANNFDLTPANSALEEDTGSALSATATGLFFDYSGSGEFLIQGTAAGEDSGRNYFCFSTGGACLTGETISPAYIYTDGVTLTGTAAPVGSQPLNTAAAPEPSSCLLLMGGLLGLGVKFRRKFVK